MSCGPGTQRFRSTATFCGPGECPPDCVREDHRQERRTEFLRGLESVGYAYFAGQVGSDAKALLGTEVPATGKDELGHGYLNRASTITPFLASDTKTRIVETPDWTAYIDDVEHAVKQMPRTYFR